MLKIFLSFSYLYSILSVIFLTIKIPSPPIFLFSAERVTSGSFVSSGFYGVPLSENVKISLPPTISYFISAMSALL